MTTCRRSASILLFLGVLVAWSGAGLLADDVPDDIRSLYDEARQKVAEGDLKDAYSLLSKARLKEPWSVDFWVLYVKVWRGLGKAEDVLWERIVDKQAKKDKKSPVFDLVRARLETDPAQRLQHLRNAVAKDEKAVEPRLLLARALVAQGEDIRAEEVLDEALAIQPGNERALVTKGDLMISGGYARSAVEFAEESLAVHDLPGLHDLHARALLLVAENDTSKLDQALEAAKKAVAGRGDPEFVLTQAEILDVMGKTSEAVQLLTGAQKAAPSPALAARLGRMAFLAGEYDQAVPGLAQGAGDDADVARALALAHARRGRAKEAKAALDTLLGHDPTSLLWAGAIEMLLGDAPAARLRVKDAPAEDAAWVRMISYAWEGNAGETEKLALAHAKDGSRGGEEWLLELTKARLLAKLGGKADAVRRALLETRAAAGGEKIAEATVPEQEASYTANSFGFMYRFVSYRRAVCGSFFEPESVSPIAPAIVDGQPAVGTGVVASSSCPRDRQRLFPFNAKKLEGNVTITFDAGEEVWAAAEKAFVEGSGALAAGEWAKADEAFGKAVEREPTWGRAKLFQAAAQVLAGGDAKAAAARAREAMPVLPEDWEGQTLVLLLEALAGEDVAATAQEIGRLKERFAPRRFGELR